VEASTGRAVWAGKVDVGIEDLFEVQDQVANGIAEALTARLATKEGTPEREFTPSPEAYRHLMRGMDSYRVFTKEAMTDAIDELERAIQLEPDYARAWVNLGRLYCAMIDGGFDPDPRWYERAEDALSRAGAIAPSDSVLPFASGALDLVRGRKRDAYREFTKALTLTPNIPDLHHYFAYLFRLCDMLDDAREAEHRALELDPNVIWPYAGLIRIHALRGEFDSCREWVERARRRFGPISGVLRAEGWFLLLSGAVGESREIVRELERRDAGAPSQPSDWVVLTLAVAGDRREVLVREPLARAYAEIDMDGAASGAAVYAHLGNPDQAFLYLGRAVALGNDTLSYYMNDRLFGPLHGDPRWEPFIQGVRARIGQWRREFRWPPA
jgi:tetratricopeptide (TPR) repeat protein